jgi:ABC-type nickel/cobalt efflux system permease component RcnA
MTVPHMSIRTTIEILLQTVLTISVVLVYGVGSVAAIEIEHDHGDLPAASSDSHHHHHHDDHDHDSDNGENDDSGDELPGEEGESTSHRHSHVVSFDTQVATSFVNILTSTAGGFSNERLVPEEDLRPDSPYYELSKPPQLG